MSLNNISISVFSPLFFRRVSENCDKLIPFVDLRLTTDIDSDKRDRQATANRINVTNWGFQSDRPDMFY